MKNFLNRVLTTLFLFNIILTAQTEHSLIQYVNPFIGTANGGNTFPGAVVPWGMISISPHNASSPSGYLYGEKYFYGFGHNHLSGTGCADLGSVIINISKPGNNSRSEDFKFTYKNESASPGYYSVFLNEPEVLAEAAVTERSGITRFTPAKAGKMEFILDAGKSLNITGGGKIEIISDTEISGYNISGGFCGEENRQKTFFYLRFNQPVISTEIFSSGNKTNSHLIEGKDIPIFLKAIFELSEENPLLVKTGISYVSEKNAKENLDTEIPHWNFEMIKKNAEEKWNENLSKIISEGGTEEDKVKFYTALYHILIHPNIISDVNGEYPLMGGGGVGKYSGRNRYTIFSLWDTYRTLHPFLTMIYPDKQSEIIKSMLDMYIESGYLPKWELTGAETYMMVGDAAATVIADSYIKGITDFDIDTALEAMIKPVLIDSGTTAPPVRAGYHELLQYGYIPFEQDWNEDWWVWGPVSTSLEYNLNDWTIARFAEKTGNENLASVFYKRSSYYKNLFDKKTKFMRPRLKNGNWLDPFDPLVTEGSGDWEGSGGPGYVEGNAWNYTWFVPQDIPGLIELFGGEKSFAAKLNICFAEGHFTITNEPDIAYPYLFNYIKGEEHRSDELITKIINEAFGTGPNGLPGNDDCGTISAWLAFSMLGFYPDCPASDYYQAGIPSFDSAIIKLDEKYFSGREIIIKKEKKKSGAREVYLNGEKISGFKLEHKKLVEGAEVIFFTK